MIGKEEKEMRGNKNNTALEITATLSCQLLTTGFHIAFIDMRLLTKTQILTRSRQAHIWTCQAVPLLMGKTGCNCY